jgi:hypothetical protein
MPCVKTVVGSKHLNDNAQSLLEAATLLSYDDTLAGKHGVDLVATARARRGQDDALRPAEITERTRKAYCANATHFYPDFEPSLRCDGHVRPQAALNGPWCYPASDLAHVFAIGCAVIDNFVAHPNVAFSFFAQNVVVLSKGGVKSASIKIDASAPVDEYDELAIVGTTMYPTAPGHFVNEDLPGLLLLDRVIPPGVPIAWPQGGIADHVLESLQAENVVSSRTFVRISPEGSPSHMTARKLYYFRTSRPGNETPQVSWVAQQHMRDLVMPVVARKASAIRAKDHKDPRLNVIILRRSGSTRRLSNHNELEAAVRKELPSAHVQSFEPGPAHGHPFWDAAARMYNACLVIGPHGAAMHNVMFMRAGCWVVEIGFDDPSFRLPSDFYCAARNVQVEYWLSLGQGAYDSNLVADVDDVRDIVRQYKARVLLA